MASSILFSESLKLEIYVQLVFFLCVLLVFSIALSLIKISTI